MQTDQTSAKGVTPYDIAFISVRVLAIYVFSRLLEFSAAFPLLPTMDAQSRGVALVTIAVFLTFILGLWLMACWIARQITPPQQAASESGAGVEAWQAVVFRLFGLYLAYTAMIRLGPWLGMIATDTSASSIVAQGWQMGVSAILGLVLILIPHKLAKALPNLRG